VAARPRPSSTSCASWRERIEDEPGNTTRFLVIGPEDAPPSGRDKTSLLLSCRNEAGGLHRLLTPFAEQGISMTRIESRPSRQGVWDYVFFVDVCGHRQSPEGRGCAGRAQGRGQPLQGAGLLSGGGAAAELGRYPDGGAFALRRAIAVHHGLAPEQVTIGNGSNDVLDLVARVFLHPGRESVFSEHAFAVYPIATRRSVRKRASHRRGTMGTTSTRWRRWSTSTLAWSGSRIRTTRLVPGSRPSPCVPSRLACRSTAWPWWTRPTFEYVDEPDYPDTSPLAGGLSEPHRHAHLCEGSRAGRAAGRLWAQPSHVAELMNRVRHPFNVNAPAQAAAVAALSDREHVERSYCA
jgi:hypothetical protein